MGKKAKKRSRTDQTLADAVAALPHVRVTEHRPKKNGAYLVEAKVDGDDGLAALCDLAERANCRLCVYQWTGRDFRYRLTVDERSRKLILSVAPQAVTA